MARLTVPTGVQRHGGWEGAGGPELVALYVSLHVDPPAFMKPASPSCEHELVQSRQPRFSEPCFRGAGPQNC